MSVAYFIVIEAILVIVAFVGSVYFMNLQANSLDFMLQIFFVVAYTYLKINIYLIYFSKKLI